MFALRRVPRFAARSVFAVVLAMGLSFIPTPGFDLVPVASASTLELPGLKPSGNGRVVGGEDKVDAFTVIGLTLSHEPSGLVKLRVKDAIDGWGDWDEVSIEGADAPDQSSVEGEAAEASRGIVSDPYIHVGAVGYQFELDQRDAKDASVTVVRDELTRAVSEATPLADAAVSTSRPPFPVHTRSEWGARPSKDDVPTTAPATKLAVVHHTDGQNNYAQSSVPAILRGIQAYHQDHNGWDDIGYNFLIDRFGGIWEGRAGSLKEAVVGAHAQGFNTGSVGISVMGDFTASSANGATIEAISKVAAWRLTASGADPTSNVSYKSGGSPKYPADQVVALPRIVGHRDVGLTACPGSIHGLLPTIRARAKAHYVEWTKGLRPVGTLDPLATKDGRLTIHGWAQVPTTDEPVTVHISINDKWRVTTANLPRPDVAAAHPELRTNVGYQVVVDGLPKDTLVKVCAYGLSQGVSGNPLLGCRNVIIK